MESGPSSENQENNNVIDMEKYRNTPPTPESIATSEAALTKALQELEQELASTQEWRVVNLREPLAKLAKASEPLFGNAA